MPSGRWFVVTVLLLDAVCSALFVAGVEARAAADEAARDEPLAVWAKKRGLVPGLNSGAQVFVTRGVGRDRLVCLVSALAEFCQFLGSEVTATSVVQKDGVAAKLVTARACHRLRGYEIESEQVVVSGARPQRESLTIVRKNGALACVVYTSDRDGGPAETSVPGLDGPRRAAIEEELLQAFVSDSVMEQIPGRDQLQGFFLIDCAPRPSSPGPQPE